jgi:transcriptional regulator with XRE-family HTH domain
MSQKSKILQALRLRLKSLNMTYAALGEKIGLSEVTVKRYFSEERMNLDTLDDICRVLNVEISELLSDRRQSIKNQKQAFTFEQEQFLADDDRHAIVYFKVARDYSFDQLFEGLSDEERRMTLQILRDLEALSLIEFKSQKELKPLVSSSAAIHPTGPIWRKYSSNGALQYFNTDFSREHEYFRMSIGKLPKDTIDEIQRKFETFQDQVLDSIAAVKKSAAKRSDPFMWVITTFRPMTGSMMETIALNLLGPDRGNPKHHKKQ